MNAADATCLSLIDDATDALRAALAVAGVPPDSGNVVITMAPHAFRHLHREMVRGGGFDIGRFANPAIPTSGEFLFQGVTFREAR